jgi:DNA-directed RNA polymerase specialized sigma24 family protein
MFHDLSVESIRAFYDRWSSTVFRFCELLLGDRDRSEKATEAAFLTFYRAGPDLDLQVMPTALLRHALEATRSVVGRPDGPVQDLRGAILHLPFEERSVFILRSVLDFDFGHIAVVTGRGEAQVKRTWFQALMQLREFLPVTFFRERSR